MSAKSSAEINAAISNVKLPERLEESVPVATTPVLLPSAHPKKSFLERQPYMFAYGFCVSLFSPAGSLYQLTRLNPQAKVGFTQGAKLALSILPHQTVLKVIQMNLSTPVRENLNPWAAFFVVGILQGGVYGQANIYFSSQLKLGKKLSYAGMFRGFPFAGVRDTCAQGMPYVFAPHLQTDVVDKIYPTDPSDKTSWQLKRWVSVFITSICATVASQHLHNLQITMHADQTLTHMGAIRKAFGENGLSLFYKGAEARIGVLLVTNLLNDLILKKAWEK